MSHPSRILLVGMMGAGKTTVGRLVATHLGWDYVDSDTEVQTATGRSVEEIFATEGEAAFRRAESEALRLAVTGDRPVVVSVAGGAVLDDGNRRLLSASGEVIWLRARMDTLAARVGDGHGRPLLKDDPLGALTRLDEVRRPLYEEVAANVVDVDELSAPEVADRVIAALGVHA